MRAVREGFELSEVPLGTGICPLAQMIEVLRQREPEVPLCLEMITRDPLKVPYKRRQVLGELRRRATPRASRRSRQVLLAKASAEPLPRVSGLGLEAMQEREDENVRRSTAYAREYAEALAARDRHSQGGRRP